MAQGVSNVVLILVRATFLVGNISAYCLHASRNGTHDVYMVEDIACTCTLAKADQVFFFTGAVGRTFLIELATGMTSAEALSVVASLKLAGSS